LRYPTKHRAGHGHVGRETVTVQGGYGACFCRPGTSSLGDTSVVVQSGLKVAFLSWCFRTVSVAKRSVAVGIVSEPENCHGCRILIANGVDILVQLAFLICQGSRNLFAKTLSDWCSPVRLTAARQAGRRDKPTYLYRPC